MDHTQIPGSYDWTRNHMSWLTHVSFYWTHEGEEVHWLLSDQSECVSWIWTKRLLTVDNQMVVECWNIRPHKLRGVALFRPYADKQAKKSYIQRKVEKRTTQTLKHTMKEISFLMISQFPQSPALLVGTVFYYMRLSYILPINLLLL